MKAIALLLAAGLAPQVVAERDLRADLTVGDAGRAFLVAPGKVRVAAPGAPFGPWRALRESGQVAAAVAADGSGVLVLQRRRELRVATFSARAAAAPARVTRGGHAASPRDAAAAPALLARGDFAALAMARNGAAVVVWFRHRADGRWRLEAAVREAGRFGSPQPLSTFVRRPCCTSVSVAISERGDAVATWRSSLHPAVWVAQRQPGERFGSPRRLADHASDAPTAVVGANGAAVVTYSLQRVPPQPGDGLQVHRAPFGAPERINPGGGMTIADVAATPAGRVLVAWADADGGPVRVSEAGPARPAVSAWRVRPPEAAQPATERFVTTAELGTSPASHELAVAADDSGRAVVAWSERVSAQDERVVAATRPADGSAFGAPVALGAPRHAAVPKLVRLVPGGGALIAWSGPRMTAVTRLP